MNVARRSPSSRPTNHPTHRDADAVRSLQLSRTHTISLAEARHVYQKGAARLLIGAGQHGTVGLSDEAAAYLQRHGCQVGLLPMPEVIPVWNQAEGAVIGLLHVTC